MSTSCYDQPPPKYRSDPIAVAADLIKKVTGRNRPLACEAARLLMSMHYEKENDKKIKRHIAPEKCENEDCMGKGTLYAYVEGRWLCRLCFGLPAQKENDANIR